MDNQTAQKIRDLLTINANPPIAKKLTPCDYPGTREYMLQFELNQEVTALSAMLQDPETFAEEFQARCQWRANNPDHAISFSDMPESPTNKLYWEIALLVFQPNTMQEMLNIVACTSTQEISIDLMLHQPKDIKRLTMNLVLKYTVPEVSISDTINSLSGPPNLEDLGHYVLSENGILDVRAIQQYSFDLHLKLYRNLNQNHPELAQKLYTHNANLKALATDILILEEKRLSPQNAMPALTITEAIKECITGLKSGGGGAYAGRSSEVAARRFFTYIDGLPLEVQNRLMVLGLRDFISGITGCVYGSASRLESMLYVVASDYELTHFLPKGAQEHLDQINQKYQVNNNEFQIETQKEDALVTSFPDTLAIAAIKKIPSSCFTNAEDLASFLSSYPTTFYNTLMQHLMLPLDNLRDAIVRGYFNQEQKQALAHAIAANFNHLSSISQIIKFQSLLSWTVSTKEPVFIIAALEFMPEHQKKDAFEEFCGDEHATFLHKVVDSPKMLKLILLLYPEIQRLELVTKLNQSGVSLLLKASANPESLKTIVALLPEEQRLQAFKLVINYNKDQKGSFITVTDQLLELIPEIDRMEAVQILHHYKKVSKLYASITDTNAMDTLLEQEDEDQRLPLLTALSYAGETVMHMCVKSIASILSISYFLPDNQLTQAVMAKNNQDHSALYYAKSNLLALQTIYTLSDIEQKMGAVKDKVLDSGGIVLEEQDLPLVELIIECFPEKLGLDSTESLQEMAVRFNAPQNKTEFLLLLEIHLSIIEMKAKELNARNKQTAYNEAKQLHTALRELKYQYRTDVIDLSTFKKRSSKAIESARATLMLHRGATGLLEALAHCALFILGCGVLYVAARKYNPNFFIFKTDSECKLEELELDIYSAISV